MFGRLRECTWLEGTAPGEMQEAFTSGLGSSLCAPLLLPIFLLHFRYGVLSGTHFMEGKHFLNRHRTQGTLRLSSYQLRLLAGPSGNSPLICKWGAHSHVRL